MILFFWVGKPWGPRKGDSIEARSRKAQSTCRKLVISQIGEGKGSGAPFQHRGRVRGGSSATIPRPISLQRTKVVCQKGSERIPILKVYRKLIGSIAKP